MYYYKYNLGLLPQVCCNITHFKNLLPIFPKRVLLFDSYFKIMLYICRVLFDLKLRHCIMKLSTQRFINSCVKLLINILGNTVGIWFAFLAILFFRDMIPNISWPGIKSFAFSGSLLVTSFSFFTTVLTTTRGMKFVNRYNVLAVMGLVSTALIYTRFIGLGGESAVCKEDANVLLFIPIFFSIILLFFTLKNRKRIFINNSWLSGSGTINKEYSIFLSFAIAGNKNAQQRIKINEQINIIESTFKSLGYSQIFNASHYFSTDHDYQPPDVAAKADFAAIENSKNFVFFYPEKVASSVLVELGYALRDGANVIMLTKNQQNLPFLVRELAQINENVNLIIFKDVKNLCDILKENHKKYFK